MPIYAYRCESCGFEKDVLQKMSDAPLSQCPECAKDTFRKQVTAAGFQLKGSGWYVTDFRGGSNGAGTSAAGGAVAGKTNNSTDAASSTASASAPAADSSSAPKASSTTDA
ncbi:FmdB family zinc ribbon protein [Trinickia fusca]|uniref:Zinc ribbon domain-containing protein n=1 Tax=Trinickia fusca TaxID=2419777 RepID=A0A494XHH0_9BURK|nr:FmdB family zinc ribbon protein [Trinickia fusca]RKP49171.1 zinc ribbon domain-containing protein [Trinickia fusca]